MKILEYELRRIHLPLVRPFRTSFTTQTDREVLLIKVTTEDGIVGWSECVAMSAPLYSPEYISGCLETIREFLIPTLNKATEISAETVADHLKPFLGAQMAKAAIETAILDAQLKTSGISFATYLGANKTKVPCGVSVGIAPSIQALVDEVTSYVEAGYKRIKLKIEPGWDLEPVRKIRELFPDKPLQVDANQAYSRSDSKHLKQLDQLLISPNPANDYIQISNNNSVTDFEIEIINTLGQTVFKTQNQTGLNIEKFERGLYVIKLTDQHKNTLTHKVLFQ